MNKLLKLWFALIRINFSNFVIYRENFWGTAVVSLGWAVFSVISILLLTSNVTSIFGWSRVELLLLTGVYSVVAGLFHIFFTANFGHMPRIIHLGQLDGLLLKPVDSQFMLSVRYINFPTFPRVIAAIVFIFYLLSSNNIEVTIYEWIYFIVLSLFGLLLFYSVWYVFMTILLWQSHLTNLTDLLFHVMDTAKYPKDMYENLSQYISIFLLPFVLTITLPTKVLLGRASFVDVSIIMVVSVCLFFFSKFFWRFALRYYTSASS
ncbi:ABC-2 family transporter protein [Candidatus Gottesmanbacteria bacterium]|nr:ABC-2 family transporter protein [Candidatus Gottesmanbacteria bacterium]